MDYQALINTMSEVSSRERANYHMSYGELVDVLKAAPNDAVFDKRVTGIGSYRGYYTDIALFTGVSGYTVDDEEYNHDQGWSQDKYAAWEREYVTQADHLPTNANELGKLLESLIGKGFTGWKGGNYTISRDKPLWLEDEDGSCSRIAVVGISEDLVLVTKAVEL